MSHIICSLYLFLDPRPRDHPTRERDGQTIRAWAKKLYAWIVVSGRAVKKKTWRILNYL
jgi:hypothetical protein